MITYTKNENSVIIYFQHLPSTMRRHSLRRKRRNEYEVNQCMLIRPSVHLWCKTQDQNSWTTTAPILSCPDLSSARGSRHLFWCIWVTLIPCQEDMTVNAACKTSKNCQEPSFIHAEHNSCMTYAGETVCWVLASSYHGSFTQTTC